MRHLRSLLLLSMATGLLLATSACTFTRKVWTDGRIHEYPESLQSVRISNEGHLCLIYTVTAKREVSELNWGDIFEFKTSKHQLDYRGAFRRVLLLTPREVAEYLGARALRTLSGKLEDHVRPRSLSKPTFDGHQVADLTREWRQVNFVVVEGGPQGKLQMEEARAAGEAAAFGRFVEIPRIEGRRILIELPGRSGLSTWSYPVRVLLTPPALVADAVADCASVAVTVMAMLSAAGFCAGA